MSFNQFISPKQFLFQSKIVSFYKIHFSGNWRCKSHLLWLTIIYPMTRCGWRITATEYLTSFLHTSELNASSIHSCITCIGHIALNRANFFPGHPISFNLKAWLGHSHWPQSRKPSVQWCCVTTALGWIQSYKTQFIPLSLIAVDSTTGFISSLTSLVSNPVGCFLGR